MSNKICETKTWKCTKLTLFRKINNVRSGDFILHLPRTFPQLGIETTSIKSWNIRNSHPGVFLGKAVLKICSKFTGEHPCRSVISIKLQSNFIEITLRHGFSSVNLLHIFRTPFTKNTSRWLLLKNTQF